MAIRVSNVTAQMLMIPTVINKSLTDVITFSQEPFSRTIRVTNFTFQILQSQSSNIQTLVDVMSMGHTVVQALKVGDREVPENTINFVQTLIDINIGNIRPTDFIAFVQTVRPSILEHNIAEPLGLKSDVDYCFGAPWAPIELSDTLGITDRVIDRGVNFSLTDTISFSQSLSHTDAQASQFIEFMQEVSVGRGLSLVDQISFVQELDTDSIFLRIIQHANFIQHAMTYYIDSGCNKKQYTQFTGEGGSGVPAQRLTFDANMAVESISTGDLLVLRNPETDDKDRIGFNRINRETSGGELNVFSDDGWAEVNTLLFTIVALSDGTRSNCPDVINSLLDFFQENLGQEILLHDWTGTSWKGVVTTPNETATEDQDGWWTMSFEFEGIAQDGSPGSNNLSISDAVVQVWDRTRVLSDDLGLTQTVTVGGSIYLEVSDAIEFSQSMSGTLESPVLVHDLSAGAAVDLEGTSPDTGSGTWRAHENYQEDGTMTAPVNAGAYYAFTPVDGTVYELTFEDAQSVTYSNADNTIWGFFEGISSSSTVTGPLANGIADPTSAKAVHLMRETHPIVRNNAYRRGNDGDGEVDTVAWTDATLNSHADSTLDLRITLDTTGSDWTAHWEAKTTGAGSYTEVGPVTNLLSEKVGAVGFSNDSGATESSLGKITLLELRPV